MAAHGCYGEEEGVIAHLEKQVGPFNCASAARLCTMASTDCYSAANWPADIASGGPFTCATTLGFGADRTHRVKRCILLVCLVLPCWTPSKTIQDRPTPNRNPNLPLTPRHNGRYEQLETRLDTMYVTTLHGMSSSRTVLKPSQLTCTKSWMAISSMEGIPSTGGVYAGLSVTSGGGAASHDQAAFGELVDSRQ